jgi:hypothetical protein
MGRFQRPALRLSAKKDGSPQSRTIGTFKTRVRRIDAVVLQPVREVPENFRDIFVRR